MAYSVHVKILKQGVKEWNEWRESNFEEEINLCGAYLNGAKLSGANLSGADLSRAYLSMARLMGADLYGANLFRANLIRAKLSGANLIRADLREARLMGADLSGANLIETNFEGADISGCRVFGVSAWKIRIDNLIQSNLIVTDEGEPEITVDNLEVAQFVYLLLHNEKLRSVIDTLTTKSVLILGRFTPERKAVLDALRGELRKRGYIPILFDFEKPANRDLTETVMTLASLSRFVIADLSDPHSIPHELMSFAEKLLSVPVQGIFCPVQEHPNPYPMYEHLRRLPHVLPIYRYETPEALIALLNEKVIEPAEAKADEVHPKAL